LTHGSAYQQDHIPTRRLSAATCLSVLEMMSAGLPGKYVQELFDFGRAPDDDSHDGTSSGTCHTATTRAARDGVPSISARCQESVDISTLLATIEERYDIASGWRKYRVDDPQAPNRPVRTGMKRCSSPCGLMFFKIAARYALNIVPKS
jgi:hypothetical protein